MQFKKSQLACDADLDILPYPVWAMPKIDGVRVINTEGKATGRSLKAHKNEYITEHFSVAQCGGLDGELAVEQFERDWRKGDDKARVINPIFKTGKTGKQTVIGGRFRVPYADDSETNPTRVSDVTNHHFTHGLCSATSGACSKVQYTDAHGQAVNPVVWLHCFDMLDTTTISIKYSARYAAMVNHINNINGIYGAEKTRLSVVPYKIVYNAQEALEFYNEQIANGYEGAIFRDPEGYHKNGRCTASEGNYTRMKPTGDAEAVVVRVEEGETNLNEAKINELGNTERSTHKANMIPNGMIGNIWVEGFNKVKNKICIFKISPGCMTHAERAYYLLNQGELLGRTIKYSFFDHGAKDELRMARFHSFRIATDIGK